MSKMRLRGDRYVARSQSQYQDHRAKKCQVDHLNPGSKAVSRYFVHLTLCDLMDYSPPGSSVHGILQARILEWVAILFSRVTYITEYTFLFSWLCCQACRTPAPWPGTEPGTRQWKHRVLAIGPAGNSLSLSALFQLLFHHRLLQAIG